MDAGWLVAGDRRILPAIFKIDVTVEKPGLDELQIVDLPVALVDEINGMAKRARVQVVEAMPAYLGKPTP